MLIRLLAVASIVFGVWIWYGTGMQFLGVHIGIGFTITLLIMVLSVLAILKRQFVPGVLGLVFAGLLPYVGLKQFPLAIRPQFGAIQIVHVLLAVIVLGVAEMINARIKRAA